LLNHVARSRVHLTQKLIYSNPLNRRILAATCFKERTFVHTLALSRSRRVQKGKWKTENGKWKRFKQETEPLSPLVAQPTCLYHVMPPFPLTHVVFAPSLTFRFAFLSLYSPTHIVQLYL
jgi:hypothetical protein